jgi:16S rRNA G1207 methylase RsmC
MQLYYIGGFTEFDNQGISPTLWSHMITHWGVKSLLDVGCGKGVSTSWFVLHGLEFVQCVEGSHDAVTQVRLVFCFML